MRVKGIGRKTERPAKRAPISRPARRYLRLSPRGPAWCTIILGFEVLSAWTDSPLSGVQGNLSTYVT